MKCPKCGKENKMFNIKCWYCHTILEKEDNSKNEIKDKKNMNLFSFIICIIIELIGIGFGLIFLGSSLYYISDEVITKLLYDSTTGELVKYGNCKYSNGYEVCDGIYKYMVNEVEYTMIYEKEAVCEYYSPTQTIYYSTKKPNKSKIYEGTERIILDIVPLIIGSVIIAMVGFMFHATIRTYKKNYNYFKK